MFALSLLAGGDFDDIAKIAASLCETPIASVNFLEDEVIRSKGAFGVPAFSVEKSKSVCQFVVEDRLPLMIEDLSQDSKRGHFVKDILPKVEFYFGLPIINDANVCLGTVIVMDFVPRKLSEKQIESLQILIDQIKLSIAVRELTDSNHQKDELLFKMNKSSSLGQFSMSIAHEINNALFVVKTCTSKIVKIMDREQLADQDFSSSLRLIQKNNLRIQNIVNGIKVYSKDSKRDPFEVTSVRDILEELNLLLKQECIARNIEFTIEQPSEELFMECHPSEIFQVLINLISNALDGVASEDSRWIKLAVNENRGRICFSVTDSGPKIPDEVSDKLMQPFFTTKSSKGGTGLGLSISERIIKEHLGELTFNKSSAYNQFCFFIPFSAKK